MNKKTKTVMDHDFQRQATQEEIQKMVSENESVKFITDLFNRVYEGKEKHSEINYIMLASTPVVLPDSPEGTLISKRFISGNYEGLVSMIVATALEDDHFVQLLMDSIDTAMPKIKMDRLEKSIREEEALKQDDLKQKSEGIIKETLKKLSSVKGS